MSEALDKVGGDVAAVEAVFQEDVAEAGRCLYGFLSSKEGRLTQLLASRSYGILIMEYRDPIYDDYTWRVVLGSQGFSQSVWSSRTEMIPLGLKDGPVSPEDVVRLAVMHHGIEPSQIMSFIQRPIEQRIKGIIEAPLDRPVSLIH